MGFGVLSEENDALSLIARFPSRSALPIVVEAFGGVFVLVWLVAAVATAGDGDGSASRGETEVEKRVVGGWGVADVTDDAYECRLWWCACEGGSGGGGGSGGLGGSRLLVSS